jgi:hypothetical protein
MWPGAIGSCASVILHGGGVAQVWPNMGPRSWGTKRGDAGVKLQGMIGWSEEIILEGHREGDNAVACLLV